MSHLTNPDARRAVPGVAFSRGIQRALSGVARAAVCAGVILLAACGENAFGPIPGIAGETSLIVVVNPVINDENVVPMPLPGSSRANVSLALTGGPQTVTDASGVGVLASVVPGNTTLTVNGGGSSGQLSLALEEGDVREIAVSLGAGVAEMASILYPLGGDVVDIDPTMTTAQINAALTQSDRIVLFQSGTYTGDLEFAGSDVTLFGVGPTGGSVTLAGNVTVTGSRNRVRGVHITGDLTVPASDFGISFSRVSGALQLSGSGAVLLGNGFCSGAAITGSGAKLLGNAGLAPLAPPADC